MGLVKAGALYFALAFAAGWVFGPIRALLVIPRFGRTAGSLFEAPLMLYVMWNQLTPLNEVDIEIVRSLALHLERERRTDW
jgi:hypothetical protein